MSTNTFPPPFLHLTIKTLSAKLVVSFAVAKANQVFSLFLKFRYNKEENRKIEEF